MLTGEIRSQIDRIWDAFWSGGISNPLEVIEQITYLLFLKRLDEQEVAEELKGNREKKPMRKRFFPEGKDSKKRSFQDYRWNGFKNTDPRDMYVVVSEHVVTEGVDGLGHGSSASLSALSLLDLT